MKNIKRDRNIKPDYGVYKMRGAELVKHCLIGAAIGGTVCFLCYNSLIALPLAAVIAALYVRGTARRLKEERQRKLLDHFGKFISSLHNAMRSGYALENAVSVSEKELEKLYGPADDMVRELLYMKNRLSLNVPAEELFFDLGDRSGIGDIGLFAELVAVAKRTGGNMGKLLDDTWRIICEKIDTGQEIERRLSSVKFEQLIMSVMPGVIILYMRFSFGGFMDVLYGNLKGALIMTACLLLYAGAYLLGRKMVRIEV